MASGITALVLMQVTLEHIQQLGVPSAKIDEIITRSGGTLTIANAPGGGTLVSVRLPFAPESGN